MILLNIVLLAMVVFNFWYIFKLNSVFEKFVNSHIKQINILNMKINLLEKNIRSNNLIEGSSYEEK